MFNTLNIFYLKVKYEKLFINTIVKAMIFKEITIKNDI